MKKIWKYIGLCIEAMLLFVLVGGITSGITKNIYANILLEQFKNKAVFNEKESSPMVKLYSIPSEEKRPVMKKVGSTCYPGNTGDILISLKSEINIPFVEELISFFAGGHAAIVLGDYEDAYEMVDVDYTLESSGLSEPNLAEAYPKQYWTQEIYEKFVIGLRVSLTEQERAVLLARAMALIGDPYNYSFLFNTKDLSYCSDLIAKAYDSVGVNLNKDSFTTSVYDLLLTHETYITYYHYFDNTGVQHVYYLDTK